MEEMHLKEPTETLNLVGGRRALGCPEEKEQPPPFSGQNKWSATDDEGVPFQGTKAIVNFRSSLGRGF